MRAPNQPGELQPSHEKTNFTKSFFQYRDDLQRTRNPEVSRFRRSRPRKKPRVHAKNTWGAFGHWTLSWKGGSHKLNILLLFSLSSRYGCLYRASSQLPARGCVAGSVFQCSYLTGDIHVFVLHIVQTNFHGFNCR